jgi:hypothetical protein
MAHLKSGDYVSRMVTAWPITVSTEYTVLLTRRRPGALLVLAYFGILLHRYQDLWAVGQSAIYLLNAVGAYLGADHDKWLEGPRSIVFEAT